MYCKAEAVIKNFRYRILTIDGKYYILDVDKPFFVYFFPFIFWLLPNKVHEVGGESVAKLRMHKLQGKKFTLYVGLLGAGIGYPLSKLIISIMDYFEIPMSAVLKTFMLVIIIMIMVFVRIKISGIERKKLLKIILLTEKEQTRIMIWPNSISYIIKFPLFSFLLTGILAAAFIYGFWLSGNLILLLIVPFFLFLFLVVNIMVVFNGDYCAKFL